MIEITKEIFVLVACAATAIFVYRYCMAIAMPRFMSFWQEAQKRRDEALAKRPINEDQLRQWSKTAAANYFGLKFQPDLAERVYDRVRMDAPKTWGQAHASLERSLEIERATSS